MAIVIALGVGGSRLLVTGLRRRVRAAPGVRLQLPRRLRRPRAPLTSIVPKQTGVGQVLKEPPRRFRRRLQLLLERRTTCGGRAGGCRTSRCLTRSSTSARTTTGPRIARLPDDFETPRQRPREADDADAGGRGVGVGGRAWCR